MAQGDRQVVRERPIKGPKHVENRVKDLTGKVRPASVPEGSIQLNPGFFLLEDIRQRQGIVRNKAATKQSVKGN